MRMVVTNVLPNQTLYVSHIYEKLKKEETKKCLYSLFGQFGRILDVVCMKTEDLRGRAWIVFADVASATSALRAMQDFPFFGKPLKLDYAKTKSDAVAKMDGSWRKDKRTRKVRIGEIEGASFMESEGDTKTKKQTALSSDMGEPNKTLFAEDLPEATNANMLEVLFRQFPGFVEARMVPGKPGISFIEFESDQQAGIALNGLQGFKITPQNQIKLSYAKK